jgi:aryl-alcohol dehydrogenase-like predicted oxidoreductase
VEARELGRSGVSVTRIVLGCGNFGGVGSAPAFFGQGIPHDEAFRIMDAAWELGLTTFDTADAYGGGRSETWIGEWLAAKGPDVRDAITVETKTFNPMTEGADRGLSRQRIRRQVESSLGRLGLERIPLYLAHDFDPDTPQ